MFHENSDDQLVPSTQSHPTAQSDEDAAIYRRRFVPELLASLHDSPLADAAARDLALRTLCRAAAVPSMARQLASSSGAQHSQVAN